MGSTGGSASSVASQGGQIFGGAFSDITGQSGIASAQGAAAGAQLGQQQADRNSVSSLLAPTDAELQQLQQSVSAGQQNLSSQQALYNANVQQVQSLMGGQSATALATINNQRATQRQALQSQLQQQLGTGYATSTAGIQALNNFDQQTANSLQQAQQTAIGQYQGYSQADSQGINSANSTLAGLTGQQYGMQQTQAQGILGTPVNPGLAYSGQIAQAGYNSGNQSQFFNNFINPSTAPQSGEAQVSSLSSSAKSVGGLAAMAG